MRQVLLLAGILCLLAGATGCETEQPLSIGEQEFTLEIEAKNAQVNVFWVWEQYWDADRDGVPDQYDPNGRLIDPPVQVWCERARNSKGEFIQTFAESGAKVA